MRKLTTVALVAMISLTAVITAVAHEGEDHVKCKKGYVTSSDHTCVKKT